MSTTVLEAPASAPAGVRGGALRLSRETVLGWIWNASGGNGFGGQRGNQSDISTRVTSACTPVQGYDTATLSAGAPDGAQGGLSNGGIPFDIVTLWHTYIFAEECSPHVSVIKGVSPYWQRWQRNSIRRQILWKTMIVKSVES